MPTNTILQLKTVGRMRLCPLPASQASSARRAIWQPLPLAATGIVCPMRTHTHTCALSPASLLPFLVHNQAHMLTSEARKANLPPPHPQTRAFARAGLAAPLASPKAARRRLSWRKDGSTFGLRFLGRNTQKLLLQPLGAAAVSSPLAWDRSGRGGGTARAQSLYERSQ